MCVCPPACLPRLPRARDRPPGRTPRQPLSLSLYRERGRKREERDWKRAEAGQARPGQAGRRGGVWCGGQRREKRAMPAGRRW